MSTVKESVLSQRQAISTSAHSLPGGYEPAYSSTTSRTVPAPATIHSSSADSAAAPTAGEKSDACDSQKKSTPEFVQIIEEEEEDSFHCDLCDMTFVKIAEYNMHCRGVVHVARQMGSSGSVVEVKAQTTPDTFDKWKWCQFCKVSFTTEQKHTEHTATSEHKRKESAHKSSEQLAADLTANKDWKWCDLCANTFRSENEYVKHCESVVHQHRARLATQREEATSSAAATGANTASPSTAGYGYAFDPEDIKKLNNEQKYKVFPLPDRTPDDVGKSTFAPEYFCQLCMVDCTSEDSYQKHIQGKKHQKSLSKRVSMQKSGLAEAIANKEVDPFALAQSGGGGGGNSLSQQNKWRGSSGVGLAPGARPVNIPIRRNIMTEEELERQAATLSSNVAFIQKDIDSYQIGVIIGASSVVEYHTDVAPEPVYVCELCNVACDPRTILVHLIGHKHRHRYLKQFPNHEYHRKIANTSKRSEQGQLSSGYASQIHAKDGPGTAVIKFGTPVLKDIPEDDDAPPKRTWGMNSSGPGERYSGGSGGRGSARGRYDKNSGNAARGRGAGRGGFGDRGGRGGGRGASRGARGAPQRGRGAPGGWGERGAPGGRGERGAGRGGRGSSTGRGARGGQRGGRGRGGDEWSSRGQGSDEWSSRGRGASRGKGRDSDSSGCPGTNANLEPLKKRSFGFQQKQDRGYSGGNEDYSQYDEGSGYEEYDQGGDYGESGNYGGDLNSYDNGRSTQSSNFHSPFGGQADRNNSQWNKNSNRGQWNGGRGETQRGRGGGFNSGQGPQGATGFGTFPSQSQSFGQDTSQFEVTAQGSVFPAKNNMPPPVNSRNSGLLGSGGLSGPGGLTSGPPPPFAGNPHMGQVDGFSSFPQTQSFAATSNVNPTFPGYAGAGGSPFAATSFPPFSGPPPSHGNQFGTSTNPFGGNAGGQSQITPFGNPSSSMAEQSYSVQFRKTTIMDGPPPGPSAGSWLGGPTGEAPHARMEQSIMDLSVLVKMATGSSGNDNGLMNNLMSGIAGNSSSGYDSRSNYDPHAIAAPPKKPKLGFGVGGRASDSGQQLYKQSGPTIEEVFDNNAPSSSKSADSTSTSLSRVLDKLSHGKVDNEDDAAAAVQLSNSLTQALIKYRLQKVLHDKP